MSSIDNYYFMSAKLPFVCSCNFKGIWLITILLTNIPVEGLVGYARFPFWHPFLWDTLYNHHHHQSSMYDLMVTYMKDYISYFQLLKLSIVNISMLSHVHRPLALGTTKTSIEQHMYTYVYTSNNDIFIQELGTIIGTPL